jgi:hypothetical protein
MRWWTVWMCAAAGMGLGCPETYGKDGAIDDAIEADTRARTKDKHDCPPQEVVQLLCKDKQNKDCPRHCE